MIEHIKLLEMDRELWRREDLSEQDYEQARGSLDRDSLDLGDGYTLTSAEVIISGQKYLFAVYAHQTGLLHHWCGYYFSSDDRTVLSSALICNERDVSRAVDRLCGSLLSGMPHYPRPLSSGYPVPEHFPCVMSMAYPRVPLPGVEMMQCHIYSFLPAFTFAVLERFHESVSRN